jgi:8-oxo-dGTP diphosphatase
VVHAPEQLGHHAALQDERRTDARAARGGHAGQELALQLISFVSHPYPRYAVDLYLYECELRSTDLKRKAVHDFRWVTSEEFDRFPFTPADEASMTQLLGEG